jgi:hypothetical protein
MMPLGFFDDRLDKETDRECHRNETSICPGTASPPEAQSLPLISRERRQVPNGSSQIRLQRYTVCTEGGAMTVHGTFETCRSPLTMSVSG